MSSTFQTHAHLLFSSESVTEGHPDKMCDQISDAILDWALSKTPSARVACESGIKSDATRNWVAVFGEVTPEVPDDVVDHYPQLGVVVVAQLPACCLHPLVKVGVDDERPPEHTLDSPRG